MGRYATGIVTIAAMVLLIAGTIFLPRLRSGLETTAGKTGPVAIALVKAGYPERHTFILCCRWFGRIESKRAAKAISAETERIVSTKAQAGTIQEKAGLRIVASIFPPPDISLQGKPAIITSVAGRTITGIVVKTIPQPTISGLTFVWIVVIEGDAINQQMKPGEPANGEIPLHVRRNVLALPAGAVVRDEHEQPFVFLIAPGGYRLQAVKTGLASEGWVEVVSGISEGTEVVVQGAYELFHRDFSKVKVSD
jgi:multidrug efflux pump subunit AcrA (membrane-fusion protein)